METSHKLTIGEAEIAYRRWHAPKSSGLPPLVLMHGAASNMTRWSEFTATSALRETRDIVRLDLRGHGQSVYRGRLTLEIWTDDLASVLRHEGIPHAVIGGHCLGANVAIMFSARYAAMTRGLVLIEPMLRAALLGSLRRLYPFLPVLVSVIAVVRLANRLGIYRRHFPDLDLQELDREFRQRLVQPEGDQALVKRYASPLHDLRIMPTANFLQDLVEVMRPLPLDEIRAPFLALLSTGRTLSDPIRTRARLGLLPTGKIESIPAKHWIPTEQPETMRRAIDDWVTRIHS